MGDATKTDEFSEKVQSGFDPTSFSENHVKKIFSSNVMLKKSSLKV